MCSFLSMFARYILRRINPFYFGDSFVAFLSCTSYVQGLVWDIVCYCRSLPPSYDRWYGDIANSYHRHLNLGSGIVVEFPKFGWLLQHISHSESRELLLVLKLAQKPILFVNCVCHMKTERKGNNFDPVYCTVLYCSILNCKK